MIGQKYLGIAPKSHIISLKVLNALEMETLLLLFAACSGSMKITVLIIFAL